ADAALRMLVHETGETAVVVRRIGLSCVCLHQIESDSPLRVILEPGEMSPLYAGALGRVLLAFAPPEVLDEVLAQDLSRVTDATPTEDELREGLAAAVMTGLVVSEGELIGGSVAVAAPVFREDGIVGAIGVLAPAFRAVPEWRARAGRLVAEAARTINAALAEDATG
ncbi:MAG: IclR family transcriptional regulator, partial [Chloroflexota bacterium]